MRIQINSFADIQSYQEQYSIPFTASISRWVIDLLNGLYKEGHDSVVLDFEPELIPLSYQKHPLMWSRALVKQNRIIFPHLHGQKEAGRVLLRAQKVQYNPNFIQRLVQELQHCKKVIMPTHTIPFSYQTQPFVLLNRLKKRGFTTLRRRVVNHRTIFTR